MAITLLSEPLTKTHVAPFFVTQVLAQATWPALMPFAPQWLSLIQPVHEADLLSAAVARPIAVNSTASKPSVLIALFILNSLLRVAPRRLAQFLPLAARVVANLVRQSCGEWMGSSGEITRLSGWDSVTYTPSAEPRQVRFRASR